MRLACRLWVYVLGAVLAVVVTAGPAAAGTVYVDAGNVSGTEDGSVAFPYSTIQAGVDGALDGDTVSICTGTYVEHVVVTRSVVLTAESGVVTVQPSGGGAVIVVAADDVVLDSLTVIGARQGNFGITVGRGTVRARITDCEIRSNHYGGIWIQHAADGLPGPQQVTVKGCRIALTGWGVSIAGGTGHRIEGNVIENCVYGIGLGHQAVIVGNTFTDNAKGISIFRYLASSPRSEIYHNNFDRLDDYPHFEMFNGNSGVRLDLGYPGGGNFYADLTGPDLHSGPGQDEPGADGIVDVPYAHLFATDHYPFAEPYGWLNTAPSADAGPDLEAYPGEEVILDGTGSEDPEGPLVSYAWDFGDASQYAETSTSHSDGAFDGTTTHAWSTPGTYDVTLTVRDADGAEGHDTAVVVVISFSEGLQRIRNAIVQMELRLGHETALLAHLDPALDALAVGNDALVINYLDALLNQVHADGFAAQLDGWGWNAALTLELERIRALL